MNWITKLVKKNFSSENKGYDKVPEDMWIKCPKCSTLIFKEDLKTNLYVCLNCNYYFRMPVKVRLEHTFNNGQYKLLLEQPKIINDPIKFKGKGKYNEKLIEYRKKTGYQDAAVAAYGKIGNTYCVCFLLNFDFSGGSMGVYVGELFVLAIKYAISHKVPFLAITASGGARMQEGMFSLMQMAKTSIAIELLKNAGLPYVVLLTDPTTGGVTASFAMLGDIHLAEPNATIAFAGARVIEQTIRKKLPEGFQTAEFLLNAGMIDYVVSRKDIPDKLGKLFSLLLNK